MAQLRDDCRLQFVAAQVSLGLDVPYGYVEESFERDSHIVAAQFDHFLEGRMGDSVAFLYVERETVTVEQEYEEEEEYEAPPEETPRDAAAPPAEPEPVPPVDAVAPIVADVVVGGNGSPAPAEGDAAAAAAVTSPRNGADAGADASAPGAADGEQQSDAAATAEVPAAAPAAAAAAAAAAETDDDGLEPVTPTGASARVRVPRILKRVVHKTRTVTEQRPYVRLSVDVMPDIPLTEPSMYFLRVRPITSDDVRGIEKDAAEVHRRMLGALEFGTIPGTVLEMLDVSLNAVMAPLLESESTLEEVQEAREAARLRAEAQHSAAASGAGAAAAAAEEPPAAPPASASAPAGKAGAHPHAASAASDSGASATELLLLSTGQKQELVGQLSKFAKAVSGTLQQLQGDTRLAMPDVTIDNAEDFVDDYAVLNVAEGTVDQWSPQIAKLVAQEIAKTPSGAGPLAEIDFWQKRNAAIGSVYEQLQRPAVKQLLRLLELTQSRVLNGFRFQFNELTKLYMEAKDNVKFLATLERHFRALTGPLGSIVEMLPSLMSALRMVWVISRHYNTDERMTNLMARIAWAVQQRCKGELNFPAVLSLTPEVALGKLRGVRGVLLTWKSSYLETRARIEQGGRDQRWEFPRDRLFNYTDHMATVTGDLVTLLEKSHELQQLLKQPDLRSVTGDAAGIEAVLAQLYEVMKPIGAVTYDVFDPAQAKRWEVTLQRCQLSLNDLEQQTRAFIDRSMQKLRSAQGAFEFLMKLKSSQSGSSLMQQLMEKMSNVVMQFGREIESTRSMFELYKAEPPVPRNQPPFAGRVSWARDLFARVKAPMLQLHELPEFKERPESAAVTDKYIALGRDMKAYERDLFAAWSQDVDVRAIALLKNNVVRRNGERREVNIDPTLWVLIQETKYFDRLGFPVPETAMNVALQEDKFRKNVEQLQQMLSSYHGIVDGLDADEALLLRPHIRALLAVIDRGVSPLNWTALGIEDYIFTTNKAIVEFSNLSGAVKTSAASIAKIVSTISRALLVRPLVAETPDLFEAQEFLSKQEAHMQATVKSLVQQYNMITAILVKIEAQISRADDPPTPEPGRAPHMVPYYQAWERRVFVALNKVVIRSMHELAAMLNLRLATKRGSAAAGVGASVAAGGTAAASAAAGRGGGVGADIQMADAPRVRPPLFRVVATLTAPDISMQPRFDEVRKAVNKVLKLVLECTDNFVRWMNNTCLQCPPVASSGEDDELTYVTFMKDVASNPQVMRVLVAVNQAMERTDRTLLRTVSRWRRFAPLWLHERSLAMEKLAAQQLSYADFDQQMAIYRQRAADVARELSECDIECVRLSMKPVAASVEALANAWRVATGEVLQTQSRERANKLVARLAAWQAAVGNKPSTLVELKAVLEAISGVRTSSLDIDVSILDIEERYRTLALYEIEVPEEELVVVNGLRARWDALCMTVATVDYGLSAIKTEFSHVTQKDVEVFETDVSDLYKRFQGAGPGSKGVDLDAGLAMMEAFQKQLAETQRKRAELAQAQKLFSLPSKPFPQLVEIEEQMTNLSGIYQLYAEFKAKVTVWSQMLWADLDVTDLIAQLKTFHEGFKRGAKKWKDFYVFRLVEERVCQYEDAMPLLQNLKNEALRPRHWKRLMEATGKVFEMDPKTFTVAQLFSMELHKFSTQIDEIVVAAMKELTIEKSIEEIADIWRNLKFDVYKYSRGGVERSYILRSTDEALARVDDHSMNLQSMQASAFVKPFLDVVRRWEKDLANAGEVTTLWMQVQMKWMYLESIFIGSDDIRMRLPEEAKRFDRLDKNFKKIMGETAKAPNVLTATRAEGRLEQLQSMMSDLERCQKSLSEYLDSKRNAFPRFFFISDDELLSILGSSDPACVQEHMLKMFDNTEALIFGKGHQAKVVVGMQSSEKESFTLKTPVPAEGAVEAWMLAVQAEMRSTLQALMKEGVFYYPKMDRVQFVNDHLGMVALTTNTIWWTFEVEDTFRKVRAGNKHAMKQLLAKLSAQLNALVDRVRQNLSSNERKKVNMCIIVDVHARDIVDRFVRDSILDAREFAWESQLRFYWDKVADDCVIRQCTGEFMYGYEYLGLSGRLVITPLTDRCYMTLTQALSFRLGGSPAGPAGTGKTETVKDLAKAMGYLCVVFNCGEGLDYKAMGSIFSGLVQTGSWGCFDEFNRIEAEVLSVVSAQIKCIQQAMLRQDERFMFEGKEINLDLNTGIFITMNPGYAGRTELPDNLKALFRPVVMVVPDMQLICEIMLFSEGFVTARVLAKKMVVLYKLAREQLSKQYHYDFGLRALKSVLVMAGSLKRGAPDLSEEIVLMRALRDMNQPKFVYDDVPLFRGLINDLFPGLEVARVRYPDLNGAIEQVLERGGYKLVEKQVDKVVQLYETMLTRHTVMVVGPTGGGKSVVINALKEAQTYLKTPTKLFVINPKAQPVSELYGVLDPTTRDWSDGLLSSIFRDINRQYDDVRRYIVYDGDVDAVWVENMNSVMDDNKLLTLPNGERIRLRYPMCAMLFEVFDLQYASPATISRCGMVYLDPLDLGYEPFVWTWLNGVPSEETREALRELFKKYVKPCVEFVLEGLEDGVITKKLKLIMPQTNLNMVTQLCTLLGALVTPERNITDSSILEALFVFGVVWSIGAALMPDERARFDEFVKRKSELGVVSGQFANAGQLPGAGTLFDWMFDVDEQSWKMWKDQVEAYTPPPDHKFSRVFVPTADTVRNSYFVDLLMSLRKPLLFVGESGTAKTVTIQHYLNNRPRESTTLLTLNFSSRTSSLDVQRSIEDKVERKSKVLYGPPSGKSLMVFVDDLNMPVIDKYGTQAPIALLKMLLERSGCYERGKERFWKTIRDVQYVAAMAPPGGGRNSVDPRFVSLFSVFDIVPPSIESLEHIFSSILNGHLQSFPQAVRDLAAQITRLTLTLYAKVIQSLPPTPSKFHYIFNLRDISRVFEGLWGMTAERFSSTQGVLRCWRNELLRVFHDRMNTLADKTWFNEQLQALFTENFADAAEHVLANPILFGDFKDLSFEEETEQARVWDDLVSYRDIKTVFEGVLDSYNGTLKPMNLVMFDDALEHLTRIERIIRRPRGNALLVGVGGSGKQSLTRLATYAAGYKLFEVTITRQYGDAEFREDLKQLYTMLGAENKQVTFMFTDAHVVAESFLELINNMLTTGMVPALYTEPEKDELIAPITNEAIAAGVPDTKEQLWNYFVDKCRDNLHLVLCMSPAGETLRRRCRNFPGLVSNTVIDWFTPWPEQALESVAKVFLEEEDLPEQHRGSIVQHMVRVHLSVGDFCKESETKLRRHVYVTPKNYLDFIGNYRKLLQENRRRINEQTKRLGGGLEKLIQAAADVNKLSAELAVAKREVEQKTKEVNELLEQIKVSQVEVEQKKADASVKEKELSVLVKEIDRDKAEAQAVLADALPALEAAAAALNNLQKADITEVRSFAKPPQPVQVTCECVATFLGAKDTTWKGCKAMMSGPSFLDDLINYDKDAITDKMTKAVEAKVKKDKLEIEEMRSVSKAGAGMLEWVMAMINYYKVARNVEPLRARVAKAEKELRQRGRELEQTQAEVVRLNKQLEELSVQFQKGKEEQQILKEKSDVMERRLIAAEKLINGLSSERSRWSSDVEQLRVRKTQLIGDCLLCAAFLSYCGPFNFEFRDRMLYQLWAGDVAERKLPCTEAFRVQSLLTTDVETSRWASEQLPQDEMCIQNGILTTRASRWPLCIDPQMQAVTWIKTKEKKNDLKQVRMTDGEFLKNVELAVQFGTPCLFANIDEYIEPVLDPVLEKNIIVQGPRKSIKLGDKEVDWDDNFRLYFTTKLSNPHYTPEISGKTSIINYSVTPEGLEDQLLDVVVAYERYELEESRKRLIQEMFENKNLLSSLEDSLLRELDAATGNLLDNAELISTLEETKSKANEIAEKLEVARRTADEIEKARSAYRPAAKRGSILFFVLDSLSAINSMYEYSLSSFLEVFQLSLERSAPDSSLKKRLQNIIDQVTKDTYEYACLGLFERHKLMFSLQLTLKILEGEGKIDALQLDFFLRGNLSLEKSQRKNPHPLWLPEQGWEDMQRLITVGEQFATLADDVEANGAEWRAWFDLECPEGSPMPQEYSAKLNEFERMCVLKCFRADRVYVAITNFVIAKMGSSFVRPPVFKIADIFSKSTRMTPVVFVLSPGADPASDVFKLAAEMGFSAKLRYVSLGQGQAKYAEQHLSVGAQRGQWVLLQNCHLLTRWLKTLEKILENTANPHADFRLWLTTEPSEAFPLGILQRSLKVVTEPPNGLQQNMLSSYARLSDDELAECPHARYRSVVYVLAFFHAVVQERRKYGKIGWNVSYDFNDSDFNVSRKLLSTYLTKAVDNKDDQMPWGSLRYLIGDAMYGGRVTDDYDRRVVSTYLEEYMGDFLFDEFQPFHFYRSSDGLVDYKIPSNGPKDVYMQTIENMPLVNTPEVFGLHPNAEINFYTNATRGIWANLVQLQPRTGSGGTGVSREEFIDSVAADIVQKLPEQFDVPKIKKEIGEPQPTQIVLLQELARFNDLIQRMSTSLRDVRRALVGEIAMSNELDELCGNLFAGVLPTMWRRLCPPTEKSLGNWILHFLRRFRQYDEWVQKGEPKVMWLSGLHIPESYLTALVQTACRGRGWPLDKSTLYTKVTRWTSASEVTERPEYGCYIEGLYLEGAGWDIERGLLTRQRPKQLVADLPVLQVIPVESSKLKLQNTLRTPVYTTQDRRNAMGVGLVFEADLATEEHASHWVLQSVCLVLNTT